MRWGGKLKFTVKTSGWSALNYQKTATLTGLTVGKTYVIGMHWLGGGMATQSYPYTISGATEIIRTVCADTPQDRYVGRLILSVIKATASTVTITETVGTINNQALVAMQLD